VPISIWHPSASPTTVTSNGIRMTSKLATVCKEEASLAIFSGSLSASGLLALEISIKSSIADVVTVPASGKSTFFLSSMSWNFFKISDSVSRI
jgi:hypothetical protein